MRNKYENVHIVIHFKSAIDKYNPYNKPETPQKLQQSHRNQFTNTHPPVNGCNGHVELQRDVSRGIGRDVHLVECSHPGDALHDGVACGFDIKLKFTTND
jgi:hypothetical protein